MMRVLKIGVGSQIGAGLSGYVAELGAAFLAADLHLRPEPRPDHARYIASWLKVLKNDPRAILSAAAKAQQAVDYLAQFSLASAAQPVSFPAPEQARTG